MYAVVTLQGFQYRLSKDMRVRVPRLSDPEGAEVTIEQVHLIADGEDVLVGHPLVAQAAVRAEVVAHGRGPKILVGKFKRRRDYRRRHGHRSHYTELLVKEIVRP